MKSRISAPLLRRLARMSVIAVAAVALQACATTTSRIVSDDQRSTDGKYDGNWTFQVAKPAGLQYLPGNWEISCGGEQFDFKASVKNGVMTLTGKNMPNTTINVGRNGQFRGEWALNKDASTNSGSDMTLASAKRKLIFQGKLKGSSADGLYTIGISDFGYQGCNRNVSASRLS